VRALRILTWPVLVVAAVWAALAIYYSAPGPRALRGVFALAFVAAGAVLVLAVRPRRRGLVGFALLWAAVLGWWLAIPPSNDRPWRADVARLAWAEIQGDRVTLHNVRDTEYRSETDFTTRYVDWQLSLADLRSADVFLVHWGSPLIAHAIMSFGFADGRRVAVSIEGRMEQGEDYSAIKGFFKQFELVYVVATERDVVRLRTNYRGEDVYLYRLRSRPETTREVFLNYLREINRLRDRPEWYNALTHNCTTAIRGLLPAALVRRVPHWKVLLNGHLGELLYDRGALDRSLPYPALRERSWINDRARAVTNLDEFSAKIREGLPGAPPD
jgi:uncharacterized protein DUF4105